MLSHLVGELTTAYCFGIHHLNLACTSVFEQALILLQYMVNEHTPVLLQCMVNEHTLIPVIEISTTH
jgi:hypothetical protein